MHYSTRPKKSAEQDSENGNVTVTPDVTPCNAECNVTVTSDVTPCNADGNVTVTPCNAPTIPNHTIPNHTIPNHICTSTPYPLHDLETSQQEEVAEGGSDNDEEGTLDKSQTTAQAAKVCAYFEDECKQKCSKALLNSFVTSLDEGAEPEMLRAVIDDTILAKADKPALYAARILENLRDEQVRSLADYKSRNERHRAEREKKVGNDAGIFSDSQLDSYDQEWIERVKRHRTRQHSG